MPASSRTLTESDVKEIIRLSTVEGYSQSEIAALYGVKQPCVSLILTGKRWRHVRRAKKVQPRTHPQLTPFDTHRIAQTANKDKSQIPVLADHYGISVQRVRAIARAYQVRQSNDMI